MSISTGLTRRQLREHWNIAAHEWVLRTRRNLNVMGRIPHLPNPVHDAEDVAAALEQSGFETIVATDLDKAGMDEAIIKFSRAARTADVAMFYYTGHALQFAGISYRR